MKGNMKYTIVKISEIAKHPTLRLDPKYWIKKKIKKATSSKQRATSWLTGAVGFDRMILICSFGAFPQDKFVKAP